MTANQINILRSLGGNVRGARATLGISQEELGYRVDLHRTYISGIELGRRNPTLLVIAKLARGLGISIEDLVRSCDDPRRSGK